MFETDGAPPQGPAAGELSSGLPVRSVAVLVNASRLPSGLKASSEPGPYRFSLPCESVPSGVTLTAVVVAEARSWR